MSQKISLIQMNDCHGYLEPHQELFWAGGQAKYRPAGGMAHIAGLMRVIEKQTQGACLCFDCGDTIHGTYPAVQSKGEALVPILNRMDFAAMTAHWEFAYGPARFKALTAKLSYPMLAINCFDENSGDLYFPPTTVIEKAGLRVGVIGIAATIVDKVMPDSFSEGIRMSLGKQELPGHIDRLRREDNVDLVVVVSHLGFPQEAKLAAEVDGIDVLLSGHTHNRLFRPAVVNGTIIIQSGCHGSFLGRLDLEVDGSGVKDFSHDLITVGQDIDPDPEVEDLVEQTMRLHREELDQEVGTTSNALHRNLVLEAPMDNLLLQSMLELTGAQMAFSNGWRYGAPVPPGPITRNDLWNIIPVNPPVSTCKLTGDELWAMMEENLERTFSCDPYQQMGGYVKRGMGLNLYFKVENPAGNRIQEIFVEGRRVKPDQEYEVCFVTTQGVPAKYGSQRQSIEVHAIEALERYLAKHPGANSEIRGSVVAI